MRNLWLVARREYVNRIRSGGYIASTLLMMLLFFGSTLLPVFFATKEKTEPMHLLVLDRTGAVTAPLQQALATRPEGAREITIESVSDEEAALEQARKGSNALLVLEGTYPGALKARFLSGNIGMLGDAGAVLAPLEGLIRSARMQERGIDPTVAMEILRPLEMETRQITTKDGERDESAFSGSIMLAIGAIMAIYIIVLMNGTFIFQGVLEEKVSRVMEVMASSVSPSAMMAGKVIGLGALGLTQFLTMGVAWGLGNTIASRLTPTIMMQPPSGWVIFNLVAYLILGFLLSATLMAAAGATVSRMEDSNTVMMPITMIHVIPMFLTTPVLTNPDGGLALVMSMVPFFSPIVMLMRVVLTDVPIWQVAVSMGLMALSITFMVWAGARVYRASMLSYGARPSLRQILGYLRAG